MPRLNATQQEDRRTRLLDAAERCFARSGFHAATMQEIAREARVSAGAVYTYFGSKEDLIAGIAARDRQEIAASFEVLDGAPDFIAALELLARHWLERRPPHKRALTLEIVAESTRNRAVARSYRDVDRLVQRIFRRMIGAQVAAGRLAPAQGLDLVVPLLMLIGDGMLQRRTTDPDFDSERMMPAIMALIRGLLGAPEPRRRATLARRRR